MRAEVYQTNSANLAAMNKPVKKISAWHIGRKAAKASEEEADNLSAEIYVCIRAKVMLTTNLWSEAGLANGSIDTIQDMSWDIGSRLAMVQSGPDRSFFWRPFQKTGPYSPENWDCRPD